MKVAILDDQAYWVYDNTFWTAPVVDGRADRESARPIDSDALNPNEIAMLFSVLDKLEES